MIGFFNDKEIKKDVERNDIKDHIFELKKITNLLDEKDSQIYSIQEDYKKIFNIFSETVIIIDDEGYVIDLNKKGHKLLNNVCDENKIIGRKWKDITSQLGCNWDSSIEKYAIENKIKCEKTKEIYIPDLHKHFLISIIPVLKNNIPDYFIFTAKDITKIKEREIELINKQKMIKLMDNITEIFTHNFNIDHIMNKIVEILGEINGVDISYIYEDEDDIRANKIKEYNKTNNDIELSTYIKYPDFPRWKEYFSLNHVICGKVDSFPRNERILFRRKGLKSTCIVPIYTPLSFWGFVGMDSYINNKEWTYEEEKLLKITAKIIGGEIYKWQLRNANEDINTSCINF